MKRKEVEAVKQSSAGSSAAPAAPAEPFMPRRVFEVVKKGCVDTLRSPLASTATKDAARKRLAQLLDQERRGGVGEGRLRGQGLGIPWPPPGCLFPAPSVVFWSRSGSSCPPCT